MANPVKRRVKSDPPDELLPGLTVKNGKKSAAVWTAVALQQSLVQKLDMSSPSSLGATSNRAKPPAREKASSGAVGRRLGSEPARTKNSKLKNGTSSAHVEKVLGPKKPALSLAQKLGLEEAPAPALDEHQWTTVKLQSSARGDSDQPCSICHDVYTAQRKQVILSCSHTFHLACLQAFETFTSRAKRSGEPLPKQRGCPLCRRQDYEKRLIFDGEKTHRWRCAQRIQATWRGFCVRRWYKKMLASMPMPSDPVLKKRYLERKLGEFSDSVTKETQARTAEIDQLLSDADDVMAASRRVWGDASRFVAERRGCSSTADSMLPDELSPEQTEMWRTAKWRAADRYRSEGRCAVCVGPLPALSASDDARDVALLSCTHVFHTACIVAVEKYSCSSMLRCPVCRCSYFRTAWSSGGGCAVNTGVQSPKSTS